MSDPSEPQITDRPSWARRVDRLALIWASIMRRVLPPPTEDALSQMARRDRPPPDASSFNPADYGVEDHLAQGRAALTAGALGEALHHFGHRVREAPQDRWGWHGRGDALQLMSEHRSALEAYERAASLDPGEGLHHAGRANALTSLGRLDEADEAWKHALNLDPSLTWMRPDRL